MENSRIENRSSATAVPVDPAWDQAFIRVESYLRAHHVESRVLLNQFATEIIREAHEHVIAHPGQEPVAAAMQVTHAKIGAWFARMGNAVDWSDERIRARGRLSLLLGNVPARYAHTFLSAAPAPLANEIAPTLASAVLKPGPELRVSNMPPAPLEFGFDDPDEPSKPQKGSWTMARDAAGWLLVVGLYGAAWAASH